MGPWDGGISMTCVTMSDQNLTLAHTDKGRAPQGQSYLEHVRSLFLRIGFLSRYKTVCIRPAMSMKVPLVVAGR